MSGGDAQRLRRTEHERERALLSLRAAVISQVGRRRGDAGLVGVEEAVDEALAQLVAAGQHLVGDLDDVHDLWAGWAQRRLIDEQRSAAARYHDPVDVGDHAQALTVSVSGDITQPTDEGRALWRIREILSVLHGDQRRWAEAWYDEVLAGSLPAGSQPRGLQAAFGWSPSKTKSVSQRGRRKIAAFLEDRASGVICAERRSLIDAFIVTSIPQWRGTASRLDDDQYAAVLFHVAGCEDCWATWHARRRSLRARSHSILLLPVDALAGVAVGAHSASQAMLARVGLGSAGAAAVSSGTAIGTKTAAVCASVVCAAAATAGGELAGVLPPLRERPIPTRENSARKPAKVVAAPQRTARASELRRVAATRPSPVRSAATLAASSRSDPAKRTSTIKAPVTPGDLPLASAPRSPTSSTPTRLTRASTRSTPREPLTALPGSSPTPAPAPATAAGRTGGCVPGSLGC